MRLPPTVAKVYAHRDRLLRTLGYSSYPDYLASPLWAEIRQEVFERDGCICFACGGRANEVHHGDYKLKTLAGETLAGLYSVCGTCHEGCEWVDGIKVNPSRATATLKRIRRERLASGKPAKPPRAPRPSRLMRELAEVEKNWSRRYQYAMEEDGA